MTAIDLRNPVLINTIGHAAGLLLFGFIIALLIGDRRTGSFQETRLSLIAAALAFTWNGGSLIGLASQDSTTLPIDIVTSASFSALSFLPAVLLHVTLQGKQQWIWKSGYAVSTCAALLHLNEVRFPNGSPHQTGLLLIAFGFGALTVIAFLVLRRSTAPMEPGQALSLACLFLFTGSFVHFGYTHVRSPWSAEIVWHHLAIPVALIVLLQDYRFLLLDAFIRLLVNLALAAVYIATLLLLNQSFRLLNVIGSSMFLTGLAIVGLCLSLIAFAYVRNVLQGWIGQVLFHRQNLSQSLRRIAALAATAHSEEALLCGAAREVAAHLRAEQFTVVNAMEMVTLPEKPSVLFRRQQLTNTATGIFRPQAQLPLRFSSGDAWLMMTGPRRGGQRYLSEDLDDMRRLGSVIVEQVERFRSEELKRLASEAELRALQAQINPHFLFNALNTVYGTIDRGSQTARRMVLNLAEMFRYFLLGDRTFVPLFEELRIVEAYLEIESVRLGDRLETDLMVGEAARSVVIPVLSIQPLVENAVKHGVASRNGRGRVCLRVETTAGGVKVRVEDTGTGFSKTGGQHRDGAGVGLDNVRRRLTLCYGSAADLHIESSETGTIVEFFVPDRPATRRAHTEMAVRS